PRSAMLSVEWPSVLAQRSPDHGLACYRLELGETLLSSESGIWRDVLAHLVLSRREREAWRAMKASDRRRTNWFPGRAVAKDAVRAFVRQWSGEVLYPADIEIVTDEYGQPHVGGAWAEATGVRPSLSLTHVDGLALALVGDAAHYAGVGVDVERVSQRPESFDEVAFTPEERELLSPLDPSLREEW